MFTRSRTALTAVAVLFGTIVACDSTSTPTGPTEPAVDSGPPTGRIVYQQQLSIWIVDPANPAPRRLTPEGEYHRLNHYTTAWSPDGSRFAHTMYGSDDSSIWTRDRDGGDPVQVTPPELNGSMPSWSPDGSLIAFETPEQDLWAIRPDGTGLRPLIADGGIERAAVWSPDGSLIRFERDDDIWIADGDGSNPRLLADAPDYHLSWSPDGTRLAGRESETGRLKVTRVDGSGSVYLTAEGEIGHFPNWSPDGSRIVFAGAGPTGHRNIVLIDPDGSNRTPLVTGEVMKNEPRWSPDGEWVVYEDRDSVAGGLWVIRPDGTGARRIVPLPSQTLAEWYAWGG